MAHSKLHASEHVDGTDNIQDATGSQKGIVQLGSGSGTACEGDDSRLTDDRDPNLHGISDNLRHSGVGGAVTDNLIAFDGNGLPKDSGLSTSTVASGLKYKGTWNANTNTPTLSDSGGGGVQGDYYVVGTEGTTSIDGVSDWKVKDWIVNNGSVWEKVDNTEKSETALTTSTDTTNFDGILSASDVDVQKALETFDDGAEPVIGAKGTAFNKDFGTSSGEVCEGNDSRLSDTRDPNAHAAEHTDGTDDIQSATNGQKGLATAAHITDIESNNSHRTTVTGNPHSVTASEVGLGNVTNNAQLTRGANDFATFDLKNLANKADVICIEDSADSGNKKEMNLQGVFAGGGIPFVIRNKFDYSEGTGTHTVLSFPSGGFLITDIWVRIVTAFNGTDVVIEIGDDSDQDGFCGGNIDPATADVYLEEHDERGAYLYDSVNGHDRDKIYLSADTVDLEASATSWGSAGEAYIYIMGVLLGSINDDTGD